MAFTLKINGTPHGVDIDGDTPAAVGATKGLEAAITWDDGPNGKVSNADNPGVVAGNDGDAREAEGVLPVAAGVWLVTRPSYSRR